MGNPQAWDRYAYALNNALSYTDPSGHVPMIDGLYGVEYATKHADEIGRCPFGQKPDEIGLKAYVSTGHWRNRAYTNSLILKGGPGVSGYGQSAEDSYTGFYGSGESSNLAGIGILGPINDTLVFVRDNTNIRDSYSEPEVSGEVYYKVLWLGMVLTGASIKNNSTESVAITAIRAETYTSGGPNRKLLLEILYPSNTTSIHSPSYGVASPGSVSGTVNFRSSPIYQNQYAIVSIWLRSSSGRWGTITCQITFR